MHARRWSAQVHLFDIDIPGGITFKESETLSPGGVGTVVDTDAGRLGIGICYDIRFPELAMLYADRGAQLLVYPGAPGARWCPSHYLYLTPCSQVSQVEPGAVASRLSRQSPRARHAAPAAAAAWYTRMRPRSLLSLVGLWCSARLTCRADGA